MKSYRLLNEHDIKKLQEWHNGLDENRGDRALLRRAQSPEDVLLSPAFAHFLNKMPEKWNDPRFIKLLDAATVAAVLARVKRHNERYSFATSLAVPQKESGNRAVMSELRFQQLQKSRTPEDFFRRVCRAVALLRGEANIISLADNILHWLCEHRYTLFERPEQRLAVRWATDYYAELKD